MPADIPTEIKFKHLMSHTFPGFFSAITLFMLIDIWSPLNITNMAIKDLTSLGVFVGFILLIGTILGIILDGLHHSIIEDGIFDRSEQMREIKKRKKYWIYHHGAKDLKLGDPLKPKCEGKCIDCNYDLDPKQCVIERMGFTRHFSFKKIEGKLTDINVYLIEEFYSYSEFYSNTFLALIPFSLISPFFLFQNFEVPWRYSVSFGFMAFILACLCLHSSYSSYKTYGNVVNSIMIGYLDTKAPPSPSPSTSNYNFIIRGGRRRALKIYGRVHRK